MDICEIVAVARCTIPTCLFDLSLSLEWYTIRKLHTILIILFSCFFLQPCRSLIAHTHTHARTSVSLLLLRIVPLVRDVLAVCSVYAGKVTTSKICFFSQFSMLSPLSFHGVYICVCVSVHSFEFVSSNKKKRQFVWNRERIGAIETVHLFENQDNDNDTNSDIEFKEHNLNKLANVSWDFFSEIILKISRIVPPVINCTQ